MRTAMFALVIAALSVAVPVGAGKSKSTILRVTPSTVKFGTRPVGSFTLKDAVITNISSSSVNLLVSIDRMPDDFSFGLLPGSTCPPFEPTAFGPGASCSAVVGFRPSEFFAGQDQVARLRATATGPSTGAVLESVLIDYTGKGK